MRPFVPNDKFDISSPCACWGNLQQNFSEFDESYVCKLATKTFQLFYHYCRDDAFPKEIIRLIPTMTLYQATGDYPAFSSEDICKTIAKELVTQLANGFKGIKNPSTGRRSSAGEWFAVSYQGEVYQIETKTFDLTPIKNKDTVRI